MKIKNILIIGPLPEPITGVSLANKVVLESLEGNSRFDVKYINTSYYKFDENLGEFSFSKLLFSLFLNFQFIKIFKNKIVYLTPGQTFFGVLKYSIFILVSYVLRKELIIHIHGNYLAKEYSSLKGVKKRIFHFLISRSSKGIVLSKSLKKNLTPFINEDKIYILPNFAENYLLNTTQKNYCDLRIVFLSNLMKEKGILVLLKTLKNLEQKGILYKAKIAGNIDSKNKEEIVLLINELRHTEYLGIVSGKQKRDLLSWSNTFVLPTFYKMEGQPISIIEAMATGNVIITTQHAGIPDIIEDKKHGFFVEKNSVISLEEKLIYLSDATETIKEISNINRDYFQENFTVQQFKDTFIKILNA